MITLITYFLGLQTIEVSLSRLVKLSRDYFYYCLVNISPIHIDEEEHHLKMDDTFSDDRSLTYKVEYHSHGHIVMYQMEPAIPCHLITIHSGVTANVNIRYG